MNAFELQSIADDPEAPPPLSAPTNAPRLSLPFQYRLPTATAGAFFTGMFLGLTHGSQTAGLRFRAENSHRLPKSSTGWYLYHKSKNYHMMLGGVKEGLKMGTKVGFWVGGFFTVEEAIDRARGGRKDFLSTVVAGLSVAGGFSAWSKSSGIGVICMSISMLKRRTRSIPSYHCSSYCKSWSDKWTGFRTDPRYPESG